MKGETMKHLLMTAIVASALVGCGNATEQQVDIWTAAATGNGEVVERYLAAGSDLDAKDPLGGSSPLIVASLYGQTETANALIEHGASLDAKNNDGATALHVAAFFAHPEVVSLLLEKGADPEAENRFGQTALQTVAGEWNDDLEGIYKMVAGLWKLELDLERIREARPRVADIMRRHSGGR
jgi:hypothetical protein